MERTLLQSMIDTVKNGNRAESGFKKEAWTQAMNDVKRAAHSSDVITPEKNKKQTAISQATMERVDQIG